MPQPTPTLPLQGRIALITGANTGIGRVTARELARRGAHVFLACRSAERTRPVLDEIRGLTGQTSAEWLPLDLADLDSVRACAQAFLARNLPLHLLINNAGLAGARGLTRDGFEMTFGVNHLGHFLLTQLLLDRLKASAPARIVTVASRAHKRTAGIDWDALTRPTQSLTGVQEYAVSKLANIWFSAELSRRLAGSGVSTYALHPGVVDTEVWRAVPWPLRPLLKLRGLLTPEQGARTSLHCAIDAPAQESGLYYADSHVETPTALGRDVGMAVELWQRSEAWVQQPARAKGDQAD
ncbi:MAG: SDR family oxidoreductase [Curvibacter sp.]|nr:SDR family oxidoreductase [Curvibacter sp.]